MLLRFGYWRPRVRVPPLRPTEKAEHTLCLFCWFKLMGERSLQAASNLPPLTSSVRLVAELARRSSSELCSAVPPLRPNKHRNYDTKSYRSCGAYLFYSVNLPSHHHQIRGSTRIIIRRLLPPLRRVGFLPTNSPNPLTFRPNHSIIEWYIFASLRGRERRRYFWLSRFVRKN